MFSGHFRPAFSRSRIPQLSILLYFQSLQGRIKYVHTATQIAIAQLLESNIANTDSEWITINKQDPAAHLESLGATVDPDGNMIPSDSNAQYGIMHRSSTITTPLSQAFFLIPMCKTSVQRSIARFTFITNQDTAKIATWWSMKKVDWYRWVHYSRRTMIMP